MKRVTCVVRPHQLEATKSAIAAVGVGGMTVSDVRGTGNSPESTDLPGLLALPIRAKIEIVVEDDLAPLVVDAIIDSTRTGEPGDGKIFIEPVVDAIRIRTEERGELGL